MLAESKCVQQERRGGGGRRGGAGSWRGAGASERRWKIYLALGQVGESVRGFL